MDRADPVVDRARAFLEWALPILKQEFQRGNDQPLEVDGFPVWVPEPEPVAGMRRFRAHRMVFSAERQCAIRALGELREAGVEQISDLEDALERDPVIGPRVGGDSVISFAAGGGAFQTWSLVLMLVEHVIEQAGGFEVGPREADQMTNEWAATARRPADRVTVVTSLREFCAPSVPIRLGSGLEIVELQDDEIAAALQVAGAAGGTRLDERTISEAFAIRTAFYSRLFIGAVPEAESATEQALREEAERNVALVLLALRVFKAGRVTATGTFQYVTRWDGIWPVQGSIGPWFGWHSGQPYVLAGDEVDAFRKFWSELKRVPGHRVVDAVLRRFGYAAERALPEDEIVDLMIAAESLFLSEMDTRDRGELRFRLSARAASLLGVTVEERLSVWKFMRGAYDTRSVIVHGGTPDERDLRNLNREPVRVDIFADELEGVIRRALQIAIRQVAAGERFPPDWEELMFGGPRDLTSG